MDLRIPIGTDRRRTSAYHFHRMAQRVDQRAARGMGERISALLLVMPLAMGLVSVGSAPTRAAVVDPLTFAATPLSNRELSGLRGGFAFGGFDISVGVVARSVIDRALGGMTSELAGGVGGLGERLEVVTRFTVPSAGRMVHAGTTVQALTDAAGTGGSLADALSSGGVAVSTSGATTTVDIGGTTRLAQHMLNTFVENADVNRVITTQLDINLEIGGVARQLGVLRAAKSMRPVIQAQIFYGAR